jgi:hypothetical protein
MISQPIIQGSGISRKDGFTRAEKTVSKGKPIEDREDKVKVRNKKAMPR